MFYFKLREYLTKKIKLRKRIYLGAIATSLIFMIVMGIFYFVLSTTSKDFQLFAQYNKDSRLELLMAKNITEMQRQAQIFTYQGYTSAISEVDDIYKKIITQLEESQYSLNVEFKPIYQRIEEHIKNYYQIFNKVKLEREKRTILINESLRNAENLIEKNLNEYLIEIQYSTSKQLKVQKILNYLLLSEKNAFKYFDTLDTSLVDVAKNDINSVKVGLNEFINSEENEQLIKIQKIVIKYENDFLEAVQRTRGYLFMVNVVMALDAYEVLYNAKKISNKLQNKMRIVEQESISSMQKAFIIALIIGSILILLLITFSYILVESITSPIIKLTNTFIELSSGKVDVQVPNYTLNDEVGALTYSAKVFRDKNEETKNLLIKSTKLTKELETKRLELERSNEELEQFVYTVSHDLKSPLVTSMGFIGIIKKMTLSGNIEKAVEKLDKIVKANERMGQLINDLLEFSRVGRLEIEAKKIDLNKLLFDFKDNQLIRVQKANLNFIIKPNLPIIEANESRILQIFENIFTNTLKYAINPEKESFLEIGSKEDENCFLIYCKDNGRGIPKEYHEKIFALFYRLDNKEEGTGIGLAVVKKIMKFHGGDVFVDSSENQGATFWLKFPKVREKNTKTEV